MSDKVIRKFEDEMKDFQDRLEILETRMNRLEKIPQELKRLAEEFGEIFGVFMSALDIDSCIRDFTIIAERMPVDIVQSLMGVYLKNMKLFVEKYEQLSWKNLVSQYMKRWGSLIFMTASTRRLEFDDFCSIVIENLGSDLAKKTIALEDIVKFYGAKNATTWKKLIK